MFFNRLKLREKMMVSILGINLVMLILILVAFTGYSRRVVVHQTQMRAMEKMRGVAATLEGYLNEKAKIAWTFCEMRSIRSWLRTNSRRRVDPAQDTRFADIQDHLHRFVTQDGQIKTAFLASERTQFYYEDTVRVSKVPDDYRVGMRPWYQNVVAAKKGIFDVAIDYVDASVAVNYRRPIYDAKGKLLGVGGIDIDLDRFISYLDQLSDVFKTGEVFLVDGEGTLLAHPNREWVLKKKLADFIQEDGGTRGLESVIDRVASQESGIDALRFENEDRYFISTPIPKLGWTLILGVTRAEVNRPVHTLAQASVIIVLITALLLTAGIVWLTRSMTRPILHVVGMFRDIAQGRGDLTRRIDVESEDEIGELADGFNQFMDRLHQILCEVKENAERIAGTTGNVSTTATQLAAGAEEQNAQAAEVASSIQEMAAVMVQNAQSAQSTASIAEKATAKASEGTAVMQITQDGMDGIVQASNRTGQIVETMAGRTMQIGEIIRVIDDIAVQTNLLALNAAIEASSAGEHGKGFAVVADEVRQLAIQTKKATKEVVKTILEIQNDTRQVAQAMTDSQEAVARGRQATIDTETVFQEIVVAVEQATAMVKQIATGSEEQRQSAQEISSSVVAITNVTEESARGAEQMADSAKELEQQTDALRRLVAQFKLNEAVAASSMNA